VSRADEPRRLYLAPWRIDVTVRPGVEPLLPLARLARAAAAGLDAAGAPRPASLGLILADDAELAALDREFMGVDGPTDVLSFPLLPPAAFPPHDGAAGVRGTTVATGSPPAVPEPPPGAFALPPGVRPHLGDIVVSVERALAQAVEGRGGQSGDVRWSARQELLLLVTHGTLHVCGWDHAEPVEEAAMRALERRLLGIS
jgi:probable rRNA maturation factor